LLINNQISELYGGGGFGMEFRVYESPNAGEPVKDEDMIAERGWGEIRVDIQGQ
jgi:hypothetical protein